MSDLIAFGFTKEEITSILSLVNNDNKIGPLLDLLLDVVYSCDVLKRIILSNPYYLNKDIDDVKNLIKKLKLLNVKRLDITLDSNPWILNLDCYEIDDFINKKKEEGLEIENIIDLIDMGMIF